MLLDAYLYEEEIGRPRAFYIAQLGFTAVGVSPETFLLLQHLSPNMGSTVQAKLPPRPSAGVSSMA
jgi:hypothetical protein